MCNHLTAEGLWSKDEQTIRYTLYKNFSNLSSLSALLPDKTCTHVRVMPDNSTAMVVLRNMGTIQKRIE